MLPEIVIELLQQPLREVKILHENDLKQGYGTAHLPYALEHKYPNANREWRWQFIFPSAKLSIDPHSGRKQRHHLSELVLTRAIKGALRKAGIATKWQCPYLAAFLCHTSVRSWI